MILWRIPTQASNLRLIAPALAGRLFTMSATRESPTMVLLGPDGKSEPKSVKRASCPKDTSSPAGPGSLPPQPLTLPTSLSRLPAPGNPSHTSLSPQNRMRRLFRGPKSAVSYLLEHGLWGWLERKESEVTQSCSTLCDPMAYSLPGSSVHGILQARILGLLTGVQIPSLPLHCSLILGYHICVVFFLNTWFSNLSSSQQLFK